MLTHGVDKDKNVFVCITLVGQANKGSVGSYDFLPVNYSVSFHSRLELNKRGV